MRQWRLWSVGLSGHWTLLPLRAILGVGFVAHGLAKWERGPEKFAALLRQVGTPLPVPTAYLVTGLEVFGGVLLLLGLLVAWVSVPLIGSMVVAMATVQYRFGFSAVNTIGLTPSGPQFGPPGYEINLLYVAGLLALALSAPTAWSLDRVFVGNKARPAEPRLPPASD